jgi:hypothetical protein
LLAEVQGSDFGEKVEGLDEDAVTSGEEIMSNYYTRILSGYEWQDVRKELPIAMIIKRDHSVALMAQYGQLQPTSEE